MDLKDKAKNEPTLADLEAFERLLRDSLQHERVPDPAKAPYPQAATVSHADQAALAELTRLTQGPFSFDAPGSGPTGYADPAITTHHDDAQHMSGTTGAQLSTGPDWASVAQVLPNFVAQAGKAGLAPRIEPTPTGPEAGAGASVDPLMAFEEELRQLNVHQNDETHHNAGLRSDFAGSATPEQMIAQTDAYYPPHAAPQSPDDAAWYLQGAHQAATHDPAYDQLADAEARLAAETAAVAGAAETGAGRSRGIFYALGGVAMAGLLAIGATFMFGSKKADTPQSVPVVTAKTDPTKEKPANPGGMEIPDQNKQILSSKTGAPETKPAQVVNNTEQPMDLGQVAKRDSVRVITPSPYQTPPQVTETPSAPTAVGNEPKRVQSVRIGDPMTPSVPTQPAQPRAPSAIPSIGAVGGGAALGAIIAGTAANKAPATTPAPPRTPVAPPAQVAPPQAAPAPAKVESRPVTAATTPRVTPPTPTPATPPRPAPPKAANAPLSLTNPAAPTPSPARPQQVASAPAGSGGFAIQLASRPTQADATSASSQLASKYSSALGGKPARVVSGEANGKTVYRVRVGGYSQADAAKACERVKAAGGGCFVTRQ